ncbi:acyl carrier protein [Klebsiella aerogenes]|uniref:acyl carrier protein n=1 Tax=Klebsiella aerogenes TaxID=548 RepID=UPI0005ED6D97|nr:acyl carrier protein [Klebsiella aerogenes]ELA0086640.1 acyl carrier protein [Klebsiella aerogenes]ELA0209132.1 acyl carrier protein [Klebsiella aerogenes]ELA0225254.1 acyl carrier protein [Klebsiella aerogenes]ELA0230236.1 acyl carrier protein [Klebsiella aerogenes]KJO55854.1 type III secretion system protein [Klebsiella aerogenes]
MSNVTADSSIESMVMYIIHQVNGVLPEEINLQDSFIDDLAMDSVELLDLLMRLEGIGLVLPESAINCSLTVDDIIKHVEALA